MPNQNQTSLFEELIASTIDTCKDIPTQIALTGKIALSRTQINMQIGELFILRINIHLNGSILDVPELFWVEPQLEPVYQAVRGYLEMDQRVNLLTPISVQPTLERLARELSSQYKVVYGRPDSLIPPEKIEVTARRPEVTMRGTLERTTGSTR